MALEVTKKVIDCCRSIRDDNPRIFFGQFGLHIWHLRKNLANWNDDARKLSVSLLNPFRVDDLYWCGLEGFAWSSMNDRKSDTWSFFRRLYADRSICETSNCLWLWLCEYNPDNANRGQNGSRPHCLKDRRHLGRLDGGKRLVLLGLGPEIPWSLKL